MTKHRIVFGPAVIALCLISLIYVSEQPVEKEIPTAELVDAHGKVVREPAQQIHDTREDSSLEKLSKKIRTAVDCLRTETCNYPHDDPKAYELAAGKDISAQVREFHAQFGGDPRYERELRDLALRMLDIDDGFIQDAALDILADLPPTADSLETIISTLDDTANPNIMEKTLEELKRYLHPPTEQGVHGFLQSQLQTGAHFAAQSVALKILPFINSANFRSYEQTWNRMPKPSRAASYLKTALDEYARIVNGG